MEKTPGRENESKRPYHHKGPTTIWMKGVFLLIEDWFSN
jgi:hypothetical protein